MCHLSLRNKGATIFTAKPTARVLHATLSLGKVFMSPKWKNYFSEEMVTDWISFPAHHTLLAHIRKITFIHTEEGQSCGLNHSNRTLAVRTPWLQMKCHRVTPSQLRRRGDPRCTFSSSFWQAWCLAGRDASLLPPSQGSGTPEPWPQPPQQHQHCCVVPSTCMVLARQLSACSHFPSSMKNQCVITGLVPVLARQLDMNLKSQTKMRHVS